MSATPIQQIITSGSSFTLSTTNAFVGWNSATTLAKTTNIPAATGSLTTVVISDIIGSADSAHGAYNYPITAIPASGSIVGVNAVYTNGGSITLLDTSVGWCSI